MEVDAAHPTDFPTLAFLSYRGGQRPSRLEIVGGGSFACIFEEGECALILDKSTGPNETWQAEPLGEAACEELYKELFVQPEGTSIVSKDRVFLVRGILVARAGTARILSVCPLDKYGTALAFFFSDGKIYGAQRTVHGRWKVAGPLLTGLEGKSIEACCVGLNGRRREKGTVFCVERARSDLQDAATLHTFTFSTEEALGQWNKNGTFRVLWPRVASVTSDDGKVVCSTIQHDERPTTVSRRSTALLSIVFLSLSAGCPLFLVTFVDGYLCTVYRQAGHDWIEVATSNRQDYEGGGVCVLHHDGHVNVPVESALLLPGSLPNTMNAMLQRSNGSATYFTLSYTPDGKLKSISSLVEIMLPPCASLSSAPVSVPPGCFLCLSRSPMILALVTLSSSREEKASLDVLYETEVSSVGLPRLSGSVRVYGPPTWLERDVDSHLCLVDHSIFTVDFDPQQLRSYIVRNSAIPERFSVSLNRFFPSALAGAVRSGNHVDALENFSPNSLQVLSTEYSSDLLSLPAASSTHLLHARSLLHEVESKSDQRQIVSLLSEIQYMENRVEGFCIDESPEAARRENMEGESMPSLSSTLSLTSEHLWRPAAETKAINIIREVVSEIDRLKGVELIDAVSNASMTSLRALMTTQLLDICVRQACLQSDIELFQAFLDRLSWAAVHLRITFTEGRNDTNEHEAPETYLKREFFSIIRASLIELLAAANRNPGACIVRVYADLAVEQQLEDMAMIDLIRSGGAPLLVRLLQSATGSDQGSSLVRFLGKTRSYLLDWALHHGDSSEPILYHFPSSTYVHSDLLEEVSSLLPSGESSPDDLHCLVRYLKEGRHDVSRSYSSLLTTPDTGALSVGALFNLL